jgi:flagellar motility protein MotE (MotC chaperone)
MPSRTSSSVGIGVTVAILGVIAIASFIFAVIFYGQKQRAEQDLAQARDDLRTIIRPDERNADWVNTRLNEASSAEGRPSLVVYLDRSLRQAMDIAAGDEDLTVEELEARLEAEPFEGAEVNPLTGVIRERNDQIDTLESRIAELDEALASARRDLAGQTQITERLREEHEQAIASLNAELEAYRSDVEDYRGDVTSTIAQNNERVSDIQQTAAEQEAALQETIASLESRVFVLEGQLAECQGENESRLRPRDEYALVDGQIIGVNPADDTATLSVGRRDRVTLGLTFEVYDDAGAIRENEEGEYPQGKAAVEIIRIDEASSVARIIRENQRNPVVAGDVFANALYDPDKEYSFVVFGNFDMNGDGDATAQERNDVEALIREWGGRLEDDLSGRTDFLVLGDRPKLPIQPAPDAPLPVVQAYIDKQAEVERYNELFERATQASIPVLNQNRLMTLTGLRGQR